MSKDLLCLIVLSVTVIVFFLTNLTSPGIFFSSGHAPDLSHFSYPYKHFFSQHIDNRLDLSWNPYIGLGTPFLGEAQTGAYHPANQLLFRLLPFESAFNWRLLLSFFFISHFTFLYCRTIQVSRSSSLLASIGMTFSGYMVGHLVHMPILGAIELFPLALICIEKIIVSHKKVFFALISSVVISFSLFSGHPSSSYTMSLILGIYFLVRLFTQKTSTSKISQFTLFAFAFLWSLPLSALQLFPLLEMIPHSTRITTTLDWALVPGFSVLHLLLFADPFVFGDISRGAPLTPLNYVIGENLGYVGTPILVLSIIGVPILLYKSISSKSKVVFSLFSIYIISFFLLLGRLGKLYPLFFNYLPGFSFLRVPGRFLLFVCFSLVVFSAIFLDHLRPPPKLKAILTAFILILTYSQLYSFGSHFTTTFHTSNLENPPSVDFLSQDQSIFRIKSLNTSPTLTEAYTKASGWTNNLDPYFDQWNFLSPDVNILYKLQSPSTIYGDDGHFVPASPAHYDTFSYQEAILGNFKLFGMANVKYFITPTRLPENTPISPPVFTTKLNNFDLYIYQNPNVLPRVSFVKNYKVLPKDTILSYMASPDFQPTSTLILEEDPHISIDQTAISSNSTVSIDSYTNSMVNISASTNTPGFLLLTDSWYPGWKAFVNGQEQKIYLANYTFRAVYLKPGIHEISFRFVPNNWRLGLITTYATTFITLALLLFLSFKKTLLPTKSINNS